jgi:peptide/nickel transport system substrate-binding protein
MPWPLLPLKRVFDAKRVSASVVALLLVGGAAVPMLTGCGASSGGGGVPIVKVQPKAKGPYQTKLIDGVEVRLSRFPAGKPGGTFYEADLGDGPKTFNPWASYDATSSSMGEKLLASLLDTDAYTGEVMPNLAKSFTIDPTNTTYTITLRQGLTWSDGHPLTSQDVVFTWNEIIGKGLGNPSARDGLLIDGQFPTVRAIDPLTVEFKTAKPFSPFLRQMGSVNIAPSHVFAPIIAQGGDKAFSAAWGPQQASQHPEQLISSGMWLLEKYESGERVVFKRNPHYFMRDDQGQHLPYLERYIVRFVKDLNNLELQFEQGKTDIYSVPGKFLTHVRKLTKPAFNLYNLGPTTASTFLTLNLSQRQQDGKSLVDPVKSAWFNTQAFRQAIDWAINREAMVENILLGVGAPLFTCESLSSIYLNPALAKGHPQDINKAKALLASAGFTLKPGKDGKSQLIDPQGHPVAFTLLTNTGNDQRESTGVSIKQDLEALGMQVDFKPMEFNVLVGKLNTGDWEAVVMGLTGSPLEPHSGANVWRSNGGLHMFNQRDVKTLGNRVPADRLAWEKSIDDLMEQGAATFGTEARHQVYNQLQQVVYDQRPFIYLYSPTQMVAIQKRFQNLDPTPLGAIHNLEAIWVQE